jgi:6-pyruvoyltetrahydropterin/6-carboxytetrahydropterin synthase
MLSITKIFHFEAAHLISSHDRPCKNLHGHSYELHVTLCGEQLNTQYMLADFTELKTLVHEQVLADFDHSLILMKTPDNMLKYRAANTRTFWMEGEPTVEYLLLDIAGRLSDKMPPGLSLRRLKLYETKSNYAEWEP